MKKALIAAAVTLLLVAGLPLFAQAQTPANPQTAYYKTIPIIKIWLHPLGYLVQYFNSQNQVAEIYIPITWFNKGVDSKAALAYGRDRLYPYLTIYWVDGKFDHVQIFALDDFESGTWGVLNAAADLTKQFDVQDVPRGILTLAPFMLDNEKARTALREEGLSAWLFHNVWHRDEIADLILGVSPDKKNTRPWVCVLSTDSAPVKVVHAIEAGILQHLPGETVLYSSREEFRAALKRALPSTGRVAADYSPNIPVGSFLDHGTALLLRSLGVDLVPAEGLVARYLGGLDDAGRASHEAAGRVLYAAVAAAWNRLCAGIGEGKAVTEGDVSGWIAEAIQRAGLVTDGPPVVGTGAHTADPHYGPEGAGAPISAGGLVQFDVWARSPEPAGVYADISWVGVLSRTPSAEHERLFTAVRDARDAAISFIQARLAAGQRVSGADADRAARAVLEQRGLAAQIRHRTGHSIGGRVHGYGVNLDCVEFPDERALTDGACFSVEPGVYGQGTGMRTEVDCVIHQGRLTVTGGERQAALLTLAGTHVPDA